jgi:hypothetical protein
LPLYLFHRKKQIEELDSYLLLDPRCLFSFFRQHSEAKLSGIISVKVSASDFERNSRCRCFLFILSKSFEQLGWLIRDKLSSRTKLDDHAWPTHVIFSINL